MNNSHLYIALLSLFLFACGSTKETEQPTAQISKKDHPYISKFHEGIRLKTKGQTEDAIAKLEECLLIRQNDDAVYYALSQLELTQKNLEKSAEYVKKAAEIDPTNTWYIQELAYMYFEQGQFEASAENFKKLVDIEPRNVDWQYGYAETLMRIGEKDKAIDALNKTEDQVGVNPELSVQKYELYMEMKETEKALDEIYRAREIFPKDLQLIATLVDHYFKAGEEKKGLELLEELVENDPANGRAHLALADLYMQRGKEAEAYAELKLAFVGVGVDVNTKMKILMSLLESSFKVSPEAYELAELMVIAHPEEAKAHSVYGDYMLRKENEEEALKAYKKALEFEKTEYAIWNQVMIMEYQAGMFDELYVDSKECLTIFPSINVVYLLQGVSANQLNKFEEALESLSIGKELVIDDKATEAEFYGQIGEAHFGLKDITAGKKSYQRAMELDPSSSLIKSNFANRLAFANVELDLAESIIEQAIERAPNQAQFIDTYGFVLFQQGRFSEALKYFQEANSLNNEDALIVEHIGDAMFKTGNVAEAVKYWKEALDSGGKNRELPRKIADKKFYEPVF